MVLNKVEPSFLIEYLYPEKLDPICKNKLEVILHHIKEGLVMDVGCGSGWISRAISAEGFEVVSIDIDPQALEVAKLASKLTRRYHELIQASVTHLPFRSEIFRSIVISEVLEHIPNVEKCLSEIARVLIVRGILAITVPSRNYALIDLLGKIFTSKHSSWIAKHSEALGLIDKEVKIKIPHHIHYFTSSVIVRLLEKRVFQVILFRNAYFISHLIMAFFLGFLGLKRKHIEKLLKLDIKLAKKFPSYIAGGYIIIAQKV
jgi:ubiquinone/menaquinone biosynthesis C-methylase UbiE